MKNGEATVSAKKTAITSARAGAVSALLGVLALLPLPLDAAIDHGDAGSVGTTFAVESRFPRVIAKDNDDTLDARDEPFPVMAQDLPKPSGAATAEETAKDLTNSLWPPKELGVSDRVQDWLARANREFQTTIIRRLSTPGGGADAVARKIEQVKPEDAEAAALRAKEALDAAQAKLEAEAEAKHQQELSDAAAKAAEEAKAREAEAARLEAQRKADEAKRLVEEQKRQEQLRLAAEQKAAEQRAAEEAAAAKKAEDERKAEAERQALKAAEEAKAKAQEEARRKAAEEDAKRIAAEEAAKAREIAAQQAAEAVASKKAEEERKADAERQALKAAEEAKAKAAEEARRKAAEDDAKRIAAEEALKAAADREAKAKEAAEKDRLAQEAAKKDADAKRASEAAKQAMVEDADKTKMKVAAAPSVAEPPPAKVQLPAVTSKKTSSRGAKGVARKRPHAVAHGHRAVKRRVVLAANSLARGPVVKPWVRRARQGRCRGAGEKVLLPGRYTVARGDSLWLIARRHYGTGAYYRRIYQANRDIIRNPNRIYQCERLYLPRR